MDGEVRGSFTERKELEARVEPGSCAGQSLQALRSAEHGGGAGRGDVRAGEHTCFTIRQTNRRLGALASQASRLFGREEHLSVRKKKAFEWSSFTVLKFIFIL